MSKRQIRVEGDVAYVPLTGGHEAIIDAADVPLVNGWNWQSLVHKRADGSIVTIYACRTQRLNGKRWTVRMHRVIAGTPDGFETDHCDGNGLNNRRKNLRTATRAQNQHNGRIRKDNTSGVKGVHWHKPLGKWLAKIAFDGRRIHLGVFERMEDAALAYAKASAELHGEFGRAASANGVKVAAVSKAVKKARERAA